MKRLVCIVEGQGEVEAVPKLCGRLKQMLGADEWIVDPQPIRQPRGRLVDERHPSPGRPCKEEGLRKALALARGRRAQAVLVLCDADDDCAAIWGADLARVLAGMSGILAGYGVMSVREYETWLLWSQPEPVLRRVGAVDPERVRGGKERMARIVRGYLPTTHQLALTQAMDLGRVWARSDSFDKLVRALAAIFGVPAPDRPGR